MIKKLKNNFGLKLLAFLFAFMLWLIVVNIDDPVMTKTFTNIHQHCIMNVVDILQTVL